jgi:CheY-like chemotaxis protein
MEKMSASKRNRNRPPEPLTIRYRKLLWGIRQDQVKLNKLVELTMANIENALQLAGKEEERLAKAGDAATVEWTAKEIECLQHEHSTLEQLIVELDRCRKSWPTLIKTTEPAPKTRRKQDRIRPTILVIDDEKITAKSLEHFLRQKEYRVIATFNAEEGLSTALSVLPDLILLDIMMPGMNGYQFLNLLKENQAAEHIPVIILSSLSRESDILEGLEKGAVDFIVKPYSPQVLMSKVTKILSAEK